MSKIRIAVVSDIHVFEKSDSTAPSFLSTSTPEVPALGHPFASLREFVQREEITVDILVCCGDMGDKASRAALQYAWSQIHSLAEILEAETIAATAGNHDMDSRQVHDIDAKGNLLGLSPPFPIADLSLNNQYWARNFCQLPNDDCRLFLLNSAAYHGYTDEWKHGRVSERTLDELSRAIANTNSNLPGVLVCHHHPIGFGHVDLSDKSEMQGGAQLLERLSDLGSWLVIHGHKHFPRVAYASGSAASPTIFSAGSFSATLYAQLASATRNQFYIIELEKSEPVRGTFRAWDWSANIGWQPSNHTRLPHSGGFGCRSSPADLARAVATLISSPAPSGQPFWTWDEVTGKISELQFLLPEDQDRLVERLKPLGVKLGSWDGCLALQSSGSQQ